jgi:hypothetical protein
MSSKKKSPILVVRNSKKSAPVKKAAVAKKAYGKKR